MFGRLLIVTYFETWSLNRSRGVFSSRGWNQICGSGKVQVKKKLKINVVWPPASSLFGKHPFLWDTAAPDKTTPN